VSHKILIVDDELEVIQVTQNLLKKRGYDVLSFMNGEEALESLQNNHPDLMIIDYRLPGKNGDAIIHQIKSNKLTQHIPIILCTAQVSMKSPTGGNPRFIKPDSYLIKPFDIEDLLSQVKSLLS